MGGISLPGGALLCALLAASAGARQIGSAVERDLAFARGLAAQCRYVDLALELLARLERAPDLAPELALELSFTRCEIYAQAARREPDPALRSELHGQAAAAFRQLLEQRPSPALRARAVPAYLEACHLYALELEVESGAAPGSAESVRARIALLLEPALACGAELAEELGGGGGGQWGAAWARIMFDRGQLLHTLARAGGGEATRFEEARAVLELLLAAAGPTSSAGLEARIELARIALSEGRAADAADAALAVVDAVLPLDPEVRSAPGGFDALAADEGAQRFAVVERAMQPLLGALQAAGRADEALVCALHYCNAWQRGGFSLSAAGERALLSVARVLLARGGSLTGDLERGDLAPAAAEEPEATGAERPRHSALELALALLLRVGQESRGTTLQVEAGELLAELVQQPGVQASPAVLLEVAEGALLGRDYAAAADGSERVLRALADADGAARAALGGRAAFALGESLRHQGRTREAALVYRAGATTWAGVPSLDEQSARAFYGAALALSEHAPGDPELDSLCREAEALLLQHAPAERDEVLLRQGQRLFAERSYAEARAAFGAVDAGGESAEKAAAYAGLCLRKLGDDAGAERELAASLARVEAAPEAASPRAAAARDEARAMATYGLGALAFERADRGAGSFDLVVERLAGYAERFPDQTSYAPHALYMLVLSHLARLDLAAARAACDGLVERFPADELTGAAALRLYNALAAEHDRLAQEGDGAAAALLTPDLAGCLKLGNELDRTPEADNLRLEASLWTTLGEHGEAERVLRRLLGRSAEDPARQASAQAELGAALVAQGRAAEACELLDPLVAAADSGRAPPPGALLAWCRAVAGWLALDASGDVVEVPGVGGAQRLLQACRRASELADAPAQADILRELRLAAAYACYRAGEIDGAGPASARRRLAELERALLADPAGRADASLEARVRWLAERLR